MRKSPVSEMMKTLKSGNDMELPMSEAYYDNLHDKIMAGIDSLPSPAPTSPTITPRPGTKPWYARPAQMLPAALKNWAFLGGGLSGLALFGFLQASLYRAPAMTSSAEEKDEMHQQEEIKTSHQVVGKRS